MNDKLYIEKQLAERKTDTISILFKSAEKIDKNAQTTLILSACCDFGVIRNGGKHGSSYGPQSIIQSLKKMIRPSIKTHDIFSTQVSYSFNKVDPDFNQLQEDETNNISHFVQKNSFNKLIHIGGGHDHIFPLIQALSSKFKKIRVLNLDAHLDTRTDKKFHSGTPFRQASKIPGLELVIHQWGIKSLANAPSNYQDLDMHILTMDDLNNYKDDHNELMSEHFFKYCQKDELIILSLDTDVIMSSSMEAVSAVNPTGLGPKFIFDTYDKFNHYCINNNCILVTGIYEYNPIFDNLSNKGSKLIAELIYSCL